MSGPRLSIVLPTYNRRRRLERVLLGLDRQTVPADTFEVVLVDDGSQDDTAEWLRNNDKRNYFVRCIHQANAGPAKARNKGVESARGELLLFIDDDVEPMPDLLKEHLGSHDVETDIVVLGPLASLDHYEQPWVAWEQEKLEAQYAAMQRGDWAPTFRQFWTGNASVAKKHVEAAGGFDPSFLRAEDVELGRRLHELGLRFRFNPRARGLHHAERSLPAWEAMHRSYGALEVKIFGGLGEDQLVRVLAENFSRIHPATRWLVTHCANHERRRALASGALRTWLRLGAAAKAPIAAGKVCGALANLNYWQASLPELGPARAKQVFEIGDELRRENTRRRGH